MPESEVRLPCPVCLGTKMTKLPMAQRHELMLDQCERCGGMWFDHGEVEELRRLKPRARWRRAVLSTDAFSMTCHSCSAMMDRNAAACPVCDWSNDLDCPTCTQLMERRKFQGLHLDFCAACRGVWFDRIELEEIWELQVDSVLKRDKARPSSKLRQVSSTAGDVGYLAAEVAFNAPELVVAGIQVAGHGAEAGTSLITETVSTAPEVIGAAVEATGELAAGVFETIFDIVGAVFSA